LSSNPPQIVGGYPGQTCWTEMNFQTASPLFLRRYVPKVWPPGPLFCQGQVFLYFFDPFSGPPGLPQPPGWRGGDPSPTLLGWVPAGPTAPGGGPRPAGPCGASKEAWFGDPSPNTAQDPLASPPVRPRAPSGLRPRPHPRPQSRAKPFLSLRVYTTFT